MARCRRWPPTGGAPIDVYARPSRYVVAKAGDPPRIAILVTGLGLPDAPAGDVLKGLPAPISVAYGAYGRNLQESVSRARDNGHEVLLQIPLEPNNYPTRRSRPAYAADDAAAAGEYEAAAMADVALYRLCRRHQPHGRKVRGDVRSR